MSLSRKTIFRSVLLCIFLVQVFFCIFVVLRGHWKASKKDQILLLRGDGTEHLSGESMAVEGPGQGILAFPRRPSSPGKLHLRSRPFLPYLINSKLKSSFSLGSSKDWASGTFCHQFLVRTFQKPVPVCDNARNAAVQCFGSPFSNHMGTCIIENLAVSVKHLAKAMYDADHTKFKPSEPSVALLSDSDSECHNMTVVHVRKQVESGDYVWQIIDKMKQEERKPSTVCDRWIEEDVLFFTAHRFHVFFRILDYFNLHKMLEDFRYMWSDRPKVIKISGNDNYHFEDLDQHLFPEVKFDVLDHMNESESVCFRKVLLVPKSYSSVLYQCKMPSSVRNKCGGCDGKGLSDSQILTFRDRVLMACSQSNSRTKKDTNSSIVFVSRKQYLRNKNDKAGNFERVMDNEGSLIAALKKHFNNFTVHQVYLEDLSFCEQVNLVHNADVFLGVHGSGLVHLWWLRDNAVVYEMEPHYEISNPTFRTLARLAGRRYKKSIIAGGWGKVHAHVGNIVADLDKLVSGQNSSFSTQSKSSRIPANKFQFFPHRVGVMK